MFKSKFLEEFIAENQQVVLPILKEKSVELFIKREDEIHPFVSGNKFRKLKYNIQEAKNLKHKTILTFGGAFSNHIVATAVAANLNNFNSIGIIRGEELKNNLENTLANNSTLREAHNNGMQFHFVSRENYKQKATTKFLTSLKEKFGDFYLIPEGGTNDLAIKGCEEILTDQDSYFDYICSSIGTGGTIAGLIKSSRNHQKVFGFSALKGGFLKEEVKSLIKLNKQNWKINDAYHFGGYAKNTEELVNFINEFRMTTGILLDPIYTGKMIFGILDLIKKDKFSKGSKILAIHTGGIQGIAGINSKLKKQHKTIISI